MDEDHFNMQLRKFLKTVGVTSQREIETAVRNGLDAGKISGTDTVKAVVTLEIPTLGATHKVEGLIELGQEDTSRDDELA